MDHTPRIQDDILLEDTDSNVVLTILRAAHESNAGQCVNWIARLEKGVRSMITANET